MVPKRGNVYLGGGSWIVSGPVIEGPISGEVGAAGAGAAAAACPGTGGAPGGVAAAGGGAVGGGAAAGGGAGDGGAWASSSAQAQTGPEPSRITASAAPEMVLFLVLFI